MRLETMKMMRGEGSPAPKVFDHLLTPLFAHKTTLSIGNGRGVVSHPGMNIDYFISNGVDF